MLLGNCGAPATGGIRQSGRLNESQVHGDQTAGDNVFTYALSIPASATLGTSLLPATIADAQARSGNATIQIDVTTEGVIFKNGFE